MFLHYCGGQLEKVNYVVKGSSCCGGEEDDSAPMDDCCKDENMVFKNSPDFTLKQNNTSELVKTFCSLFYLDIPFSSVSFKENLACYKASNLIRPPRLQNTLVISTSVLRV